MALYLICFNIQVADVQIARSSASRETSGNALDVTNFPSVAMLEAISVRLRQSRDDFQRVRGICFGAAPVSAIGGGCWRFRIAP